MEIKIEKGVKYEREKPYKNLSRMETGDSFLISEKDRFLRYSSSACQYGKIYGKKFSILKVAEGGWRLWRVE